eukprot:CAMPEP_0194526702 /NCGR_PEP_ID=MMETSP0253-20130528/62586_1 /TAXON_ID=2966 /ORGANISM="Noctiluca scintillans" /LENGTH=64 /DNA_ID=CAMNT_0039371559 /DNA_START=701 /DNA_END=892 /DNA_ORIENTATION=-
MPETGRAPSSGVEPSLGTVADNGTIKSSRDSSAKFSCSRRAMSLSSSRIRSSQPRFLHLCSAST